MGFESIAFLAALPLAAAPILLHLFDRRRYVVIEWGAMQFLLDAATRRTSARRLKQWLLLLLRVLAIAALVFALSRPMLPGTWFGRSDRGETIVVLDNSMSMQRTVDDETLFARAVRETRETLDTLPSGDSIRVLLSSPYPVWALGSSLRVDSVSRPAIAEQLQELQPTQGRSDLLSALFEAVQAEFDPTHRRRRIVLLTDGQRSDWAISDTAGWKRLREVLAAAAVPTQLDIVELRESTSNDTNVAVNAVSASRTVVGIDQTFSVTAELQNHGRVPVGPATAHWSVDGDTMQESQVPELQAGEIHEVVWQHSFSETGIYSLKCRVDGEDALQSDNEASLVVEVVNEVPVLVLETAPELAELQRDAFFVEAALGWLDGEPSALPGVFVPESVDEEQLERVDLDDYRAVIIPNLTVLKPEVIARLVDFVSEGGGLWIAAGPRTDVEVFNQYLFADGSGLSPLALEGIADETDVSGDASRTTVDPQVNDHPAVAALADTERLDTADVVVEQRFRFVPPPEGEDVSVLLGLSSGETLAVEKFVGRGRVIVQAIPLRLQWSDLVRSHAFVVMMQDWLAYLTQPRATRHNLSPGDPITVHLADADSRDATLHTPHGDEIELTADATAESQVFRSSRTVLPGEYVLELGALGDRIPFYVRRDPLESDLTQLSAADHELLSELTGLSRAATESALAGSGFNDPLWPMLFMLLIAVIVAELMLSGVIARERFGVERIAETTEHFGGLTADTLPAAGPASASSHSERVRKSERETVEAGK